MTITIKDIEKLAKSNKFPNQYPDKKFRKEHWKIIEPFLKYINAYKTDCYLEVNNYYRTGKIKVLDPKTNCKTIRNIDSNKSVEEIIKLIATKMEELYKLVNPLKEDIIVYRGIYNGMIGTNFFDHSECIKSEGYNGKNLFSSVSCNNIVPISLFKNYTIGTVEKYIYESLGFTSLSTNIDIAKEFTIPDETLLMMKLPAGTKFIMPLLEEDDDQEEIILFPNHSTFLLYDKIQTKKPEGVYIGCFCNDLNKFRNPSDVQSIKYNEMKKDCPEPSNEAEPLTYEDWADIPYQEYVKNDKYLHQCYRLTNLLKHFEAGLTQKKNNVNYPKWPFDPYTRIKIPASELFTLYQQAEKANIPLPPVFRKFVEAVFEGSIDEDLGMAPEEKEGHPSKEYLDFILQFLEIHPNIMPQVIEGQTEEELLEDF